MIPFASLLALSAAVTSVLATTAPPNCPLTDTTGTSLNGIGITNDGIICHFAGGDCTYNQGDGSLKSGSTNCPSSIVISPSSGTGGGDATFGAATCLATDQNNSPLTNNALSTTSLTCSYQGGDCVYDQSGKLTSGSNNCASALEIAKSTKTVISCPFGDKNSLSLTGFSIDDNLTCTYNNNVDCTYDPTGKLTITAVECPDNAVVNQPSDGQSSISPTATGTSTTPATSNTSPTSSSSTASPSGSQQPSSALRLTQGSAIILTAVALSLSVL